MKKCYMNCTYKDGIFDGWDTIYKKIAFSRTQKLGDIHTSSVEACIEKHIRRKNGTN